MFEYPEDENNSTMIKIKLENKLRTQLIRNRKIGCVKQYKYRRAKSPRPCRLERNECREKKNGAPGAIRTPDPLIRSQQAEYSPIFSKYTGLSIMRCNVCDSLYFIARRYHYFSFMIYNFPALVFVICLLK